MCLFVDPEDARCEFAILSRLQDRHEIDGSWDLGEEDVLVDLVAKFSQK